MGFMIQHEGGRSIPRTVCDGFGDIITDYNFAGVVWTKDEGLSPIKILCKSKNNCLNKPPYEHHPWQEMRDFMLWAAYNSGLKTEAQLRADWEASEQMANF